MTKKLPLRLASGASNYGIGTIISHVFPDESERAIAYASEHYQKDNKLFAARKRSARTTVWNQKVLPILLWKNIHSGNRP